MTMAPFVRPIGINVDAAGRVLVADFDSHRVVRLSASLAFDGWLGRPRNEPDAAGSGWRFDAPRAVRGDMAGAFARPHGITFDADGNVLVTELDNCRVQVFAESGVPLRRIPAPGSVAPVSLVGPTAARFGADGNLYVADFKGNAVHRYDGEGRFLGWYGDDGGDGACGFHHDGTPRRSSRPCGFFRPHVAQADGAGFLVVVDTWNHRLTRFDSGGRFAGWLGADADGVIAAKWRQGGTAMESPAPGGFNAPVSVVSDDDGNLLVAEYGNHRIQRFSPDGGFLGWTGGRAGGGVAPPWTADGESRAFSAPGAFRHPYDLAFHRGVLYVADTENGRIQAITLSGPTGST